MQEKLKALETLLKQMQTQFIKASRLTKEVIKLYDNPSGNAYKIKERANKLKEMIEKIDPDKSQYLEPVYELLHNADRLKDELRFEFGGELEKELKQRGFELRGQLPTLYANYYTIKTDFQAGKAIILFGPETLMSGVVLKPQQLANTIQEIDKELNKEIVPMVQILGFLYEAWKRTGEPKPSIIKVLRELVFLIQPTKFVANPSRKNFMEYTRAKFGDDLYKLEKSQNREINGSKLSLITATFDATAQKGNYIWVPTNERGDGINYAYLTFK